MAYIGQDIGSRTSRTTSTFTSANNQTTFFPNGGYTRGFVDVFVDGTKKQDGVDYNANNSLSVVFTSPVSNGMVVETVAYSPLALWTHVARTGDAMTGDLTVPSLIASNNVTGSNATFGSMKINTGLTVNNALVVTGPLTQTGDVALTGNLVLTGSLIITGNATSVATQSLEVEDTIIKLGANNSLDTLDIGFIGRYSNGTANVWSGLVRDASEQHYWLFTDYTGTVNNNIDINHSSFVLGTMHANFEGNVTSNNVLATVVNAGNVNVTSSLTITGDAAGIKQNTTTVYGGDAGVGFGRIEYYNNAWVFNAGSDSSDVAIFQRGNEVKAVIDNTGTFSGTANNASYLGGVISSSYALKANPTFTGTTTTAVLAAGNTTITGFANVSTTLQVTGAATFSNTINATGLITGTITTANNATYLNSQAASYYLDLANATGTLNGGTY